VSARKVASEAVVQLGLAGARLRLLLDGYNTTYRVDQAGERYALRVTRSGPSLAHVQAEVAWMRALASDTGLRLATPLGVVEVRSRVCVLTSWVVGTTRAASLMPRHQHAVGVAMAQLHQHALGWSAPPGWERPRLDEVWLDEPSPLPQLAGEAHDVFAEAAERIRPLLTQLVADQAIALHGDLHQYNVKQHPRLGPGLLDFDDCAVGHPAQDVAIAAYYLSGHRREAALLGAFEAGYRTVRPWPVDTGRMAALRAWRVLGLCASVHAHPSEDLRARIPEFLPRWEARLRGWLEAAN